MHLYGVDDEEEELANASLVREGFKVYLHPGLSKQKRHYSNMSDSYEIIVHCYSDTFTLFYEYSAEDTDLEVLRSQIFSIVSEKYDLTDDFVLLNYTGLAITSSDDLYNIVFGRASTSESSSTPSHDLWCHCATATGSDLKAKCFNNIAVKEEKDSESFSVLQLQYRMIDTTYRLCGHCRSILDSSLIDKSSNELASYVCDSTVLTDMGILPQGSSEALDIGIPAELYLRRQYYRQAIADQEINIRNKMSRDLQYAALINSKRQEFLGILKSGHDVVQTYEDRGQQRAARSVISFAKVIEYTMNYRQDVTMPADVALLHGLLQWFKCDHFKWTNKPPCGNLSCLTAHEENPLPQNMSSLGMTPPSNEERTLGWAGRVELYECQHCHQQTRFARCNNPSYLLTKSPRGRCGEFANAFGLVCRSLGFDVRYVRDLTDHVWIEIWLPSLQRFVHADCCERALDTPLLYEAGWGKQLTYIMSFSRYGVVEASAKYSRCLNDVIVRREELQYGEEFVQQTICQRDEETRTAYLSSASYQSKTVFDKSSHDSNSAEFPAERYLETLYFGMDSFEVMTEQELPREIIKARSKLLAQELEGMSFLDKTCAKLEELRGRISGSLEWRAARGELGKGLPSNSESDT
jgi:peptide-N4-(N-acetyl-beta-glucosaminyl)asparagine amidase